jgi:hypothetical protein
VYVHLEEDRGDQGTETDDATGEATRHPGRLRRHVGARADDDPGTSPGAVDLSGTYSYNDHQSGRPAHGTIGDRTPAGLATYPATFTMTLTKDGVWQWHQEGSRRTTTAAATRCLATASP